MRIKRVAYILNVFPKLSETFIVNELAHLRSRGIDLRIISLREPAETLRHSLVQKAGLLELTSYNPGDSLELLRQFQPQIIHAHFSTEPAAAAWQFSKILKVPFTFTAHGYDIHRKPPADFHDRAMAAASVVTVSRANVTYIERQFSVPAKHIRLIPCGVDIELFKPIKRPPIEKPLIVCIARHVVVKNLGLLLRACALLLDRGVVFKTIMVGDGPCRAELESLRNELQLESVEMPGAADQDTVLNLWQQADIGVLSSNNEGFPVCLLEAGSCGVPVVTTAVGGVPELVQHGSTGFCVPPGDSRAFADALAELLSKPALRVRMGLAARQRVAEHFSINQQITSLVNLWEEILDHAEGN